MDTLTTTFHAVDDQALSFAEALLIFHEYFRFPLRLKSLSPSGLTARFYITHPDQIESTIGRANRVIKVLQLPLSATLDLAQVGGIWVKMILVIKPAGKW